jgi:hypothetical protein
VKRKYRRILSPGDRRTDSRRSRSRLSILLVRLISAIGILTTASQTIADAMFRLVYGTYAKLNSPVRATIK